MDSLLVVLSDMVLLTGTVRDNEMQALRLLKPKHQGKNLKAKNLQFIF